MDGLNGLRTRSHNKGDSDDEHILLQWREDSCVLCSTKCFVLDGPENSGKVPTDDLLSLLDTAIDEGPDAVTVCVSCSGSIGKLQGIYEELSRLQSTFKSVQREIVSKVLQSEELSKGNIFDNNAVRTGLFKRWKSESPNKDSSPGESLLDIHTKIPRDLIISPATPSAEEDQEETQESFQNDHEIQFHLDPNDFDDTDMKFNTGSEENSNGSVPTRDVECIEVDDSDDEEEEVDAANLIPAIEINTYSENEQGSVDFNHDQWDNSPTSGNSSSMDVKDLHAFLAQNHGALPIQDFYFTNGDVFNNEPNRLFPHDSVLPVGLPALSPAYRQDGDRAKAVKRVKRKSKSSSGTSKIPTFSCTVCTEQFNSRDKFKEHLESHNGKAPTCDICQKVFPRKHNLMIHMRTHTGEKPYDCPVCHKPYSDRSNFNAHVRKHMAKPFACTICGRMFDKSQAAHVHATSMHPEEAAGKIISKVTFRDDKP